MWKLKIAEGNNPWLRTVNNHVGRQIWEFDPDLVATPDEITEIEEARENFRKLRFQKKRSSDLLMQIQVIALSVTGALSAVLSKEHQREIRRYLFNHQTSCMTRGRQL